MGIEYLWGSPVQLETSEVVATSSPKEETKEPEIKWQRVLYTMDNRKLSKKNI
jgi:stage V sporulation protein R